MGGGFWEPPRAVGVALYCTLSAVALVAVLLDIFLATTCAFCYFHFGCAVLAWMAFLGMFLVSVGLSDDSGPGHGARARLQYFARCAVMAFATVVGVIRARTEHLGKYPTPYVAPLGLELVIIPILVAAILLDQLGLGESSCLALPFGTIIAAAMHLYVALLLWRAGAPPAHPYAAAATSDPNASSLPAFNDSDTEAPFRV